MSGVRTRMQCATKIGFMAFALAALLATPVRAQVQANPQQKRPAQALGFRAPMQDINEVVVQNPRIANRRAAEFCGLTQQDVTQSLVSVLKNANVPALWMTSAPPRKPTTVRIKLIPEMAPLNSQGIDCTTWVALTAETRGMTAVPGMPGQRNVVVTLWRGGTLVSSAEMGHWRTVTTAFEQLALQFAKQYKIDQPPELPPLQ